tara:strand:- start:35102 stop:35452 length:351 start_codon:yes stop_codon:yes gene_type:complete
MKQQVKALYLAGHDPRTPIAAKWLVVIVVAYALSLIDLIPDFIPILGYLDDLILLSLGIYLAVKLIPEPLWQEFQTQAEQSNMLLPKSRRAVLVVGLIWCMSLVVSVIALWYTYAV